ncbi:MAG: class I SAM-dependent methyltransferase [Saprospiraceae bacterium]|nr:MAG: class I SAM-dependent methyltransferase [Saprospiraceae bacterium]
MNYGYEDSSQKIPLDWQDESDRFSIQLYHHLASGVDLRNKDVADIGCGRGGGLAYIAKTFSPSSAIGIDLEKSAVNFANKFYHINGLSFRQGNAQKVPLANNSCDVVLNVESSHRYLEMDIFLSEVCRILKEDGYFLYTDFRSRGEFPDLKQLLSSCGLTVIEEHQINSQVAASLAGDSLRRKDLCSRLTPKFIRKKVENFSGVVGSPTCKKIVSGEIVYFLFILQKKSLANPN